MLADTSNIFTKKAFPIENPNINTNLVDKRLPRYVTSAEGMIGDSHLIYFLDQEKPANRNDIILNSFTKRKFQSGHHDDEQHLPKTAKCIKEGNCYQQPLYTDNEGYAISTSGWHDEIFIPDDKIRKKAFCSGFDDSKENIIIGYYPDGKCIISKPSYFSSTITSIAMLLNDEGVDYKFKKLFESPRCLEGIYKSEFHVDHELQRYGYERIQLSFEDEENDWVKRGNEVKEWIGKYGPLLIVADRQKTFVLDSIDENGAVIRDPSHGWRITIDNNDLYEELLFVHALKKKG